MAAAVAAGPGGGAEGQGPGGAPAPVRESDRFLGILKEMADRFTSGKEVYRSETGLKQALADLAASTQAAIVEVLVAKSMLALARTGLGRLVVAGGVGANAELRRRLDAACAARGVRVHYPELHLCSDNGAMIALAGAMRATAGEAATQDLGAFDVRPRWPLGPALS